MVVRGIHRFVYSESSIGQCTSSGLDDVGIPEELLYIEARSSQLRSAAMGTLIQTNPSSVTTATIITTVDPLLLDLDTSTTALDLGISSSSSYIMNKQHNACDECRTRKLKCSGELTGCSRCKTDRAACIYSPRKQMGRPRKKRRDDSELEPQTYHTWPMDNNHSQPLGSPGLAADTNASMMYTHGSPPPQSYGMASPPMDYNFGNIGLDYVPTTSPPPSSYPLSIPPLDPSAPMDYSLSFTQSSHLPQSFSPLPWQQTTYSSPSYPLQNPAASSYLSSPPPTTTPTPNLSPLCACLPTLNQTLQTLPSATSDPSFPHTLQPLRQATAVASSLLYCQTCPHAYASALQNSMGSVTLLSLVIRAYQGLLGQIDQRSRSDEKIQFREPRPLSLLHLTLLIAPSIFIPPLIPSQEWIMLTYQPYHRLRRAFSSFPITSPHRYPRLSLGRHSRPLRPRMALPGPEITSQGHLRLRHPAYVCC